MNRFWVVISLMLPALGAAAPSFAGPAGKTIGDEVDVVGQELNYADELMRAGFPDYAQIILDRFRDDPSVAVRKRRMEIDGLGMRGKFAEAAALIKKLPSQTDEQAWGMKLSLADWYYAWGKYKEAQELYEGFMKQYPQGPPPALKKFFMSSAYKYAQMLILMGKYTEAVAAYDKALLTVPGDAADKEKNENEAQKIRAVRRQLLGEKVELMMKIAEKADAASRARIFKDMEAIAAELYWYQDVWLGKAIVVDAHIKMLQGNVDGAMELLDSYKRVLEQIDDNLRVEERKSGEPLTKLSPMAQARYMLGVIFQKEAEKLIAENGDRNKALILLAGRRLSPTKETSGALQHFVNVFIRYPTTPWAADAGLRLEQVKVSLAKLGKEVDIKADPKQMEKVKASQFSHARVLFNQQQFEGAIEAYSKVLELFPEGDLEILAMGDIARSYTELALTHPAADPEREMLELHADTVIRHIAERFGRNKSLLLRAGDEVLKLAREYEQREMQIRKEAVFSVFLAYCPDHPATPPYLLKFGREKYDKQDFASALVYFNRIATNYPGSPVYGPALSQSSACYSKMGDYSNQVAVLETLLASLEKEDKPGSLFINARFQLGYAYRQMAQSKDQTLLRKALNEFIKLDKLISELPERDARYQNTPEEAEANRQILERTLLFKGMCYSLLTEPPEKVEDFRKLAVKALDGLLEKFPKSEYAPTALIQIGTIFTAVGDTKAAERALSRLQEKYPNSPEAKKALPTLGFALLEQGRRDQAVQIFKKMFEGTTATKYNPLDILNASQELEKAKEYTVAAEGYENVLAATKDRAICERALVGKGKCMFMCERYAESVEALEEVTTKYKSSTTIVEALLFLSQSYAELGGKEKNADERLKLFNKAVIAANKVIQYDRTLKRKAEITLSVASLHLRRSEAEEKFGSKEKSQEAMGKAIATLITQTMDDPNNPETRAYVEEACIRLVPILLKAGKWKDAFEACAGYTRDFPMGKSLREVQNWQNEAKVKMIMEGTAPDSFVRPQVEPGAGAEKSAAPEPEEKPKPAEPAAKAEPGENGEQQ